MRDKIFTDSKKSGKGICLMICTVLIFTSISATIGVSNRIIVNENQQVSFYENNDALGVQKEQLDVLSYTFQFSEPVLDHVILPSHEFTKISMPGVMNVGRGVGQPFLPVSFAKILLPPMKKVISLDVSGQSHDIDAKDFDLIDTPILPYQSSMPLGLKKESFEIRIDSQVYDSSEVFPKKRYEDFHIGYCRGYTICDISLNPIEYIPSDGKLSYYSELTVEIEMENTDYINQFYRNRADDRVWVESLVCNPDGTKRYNTLPLGDIGYSGGLCDSSDEYDYVIITRESLMNFSGTAYTWDDFISRKEAEGLSTSKVSVENIITCSDYWNPTSLFNDTAAKIREFCKDAYQDWGTQYILIAGDHEGVAGIPRRLLHYGLGEYQENVESDLYWSNLDNNFNADSDYQWGESNDAGFDLYSELFIGSLPCDTGLDLSNWMTKSFYYADAYDPEYLNNAGFYGGDTSWSAQGDDFIDYSAIKGLANYLGPYPGDSGPYPTWLGFQYGFETWNNNNPAVPYDLSVKWTAESPNPGWSGGSEYSAINGLKSAINNDQVTLISAIAHANEYMSMDVYDYNWESQYHNTKPFFLHDYGCHCGDMSAAGDGVLHSMLFHSDTELAFACVYNTGYGWGNYYTTNSSSAVQQKSFWDYLFDITNNSNDRDNWQMGRAQAWSKDTMAPTIGWDYYDQTWRGVIESCLLFGDPAQRIKQPADDHDIGVLDLDVEDILPHNQSVTITANVLNCGLNNESAITVNFVIDGTTEDVEFINSLDLGESHQVSFDWFPDFGFHNVNVEVVPIPGENYILNNAMSKEVEVIPVPDIWVSPTEYSINLNEGVIHTESIIVGNEQYAEAQLTGDVSFLDNPSWLSVTPETLFVPVGMEQTLDVVFDTNGLAEGIYEASVVLTTNDLDEATVIIPVVLNVVYENNVGPIGLNYPLEPLPAGVHTISAVIENFGSIDQTNVLVNCSIVEGIFGTFLSENFSGGVPPAGWTVEEPDANEWQTYQNNRAGGTAPEMRLHWNSINGDYSYIETPPVDTVGAAQLQLRFNHWIDDYENSDDPIYCRVYTRAETTDTWTDVTPWSNPIYNNVGPEYVTIDIGFDSGPATQVRFEYEGYYFYIDYWYIDDVLLISENPRDPGDIVYTCEATVEVEAYSTAVVEFNPPWHATAGAYGATITTLLPDDQDTSNDYTGATIIMEEVPVLCGDVNTDGIINVSDAVFIINYVFTPGSPEPHPVCSADANGDSQINVSDAVHLINYIFSNGPPPVSNCCD